MAACPSQDHRDDLGRLLSGDLPEAEQARLTDHLDTCGDCRKALDALAARSGLWGDLSLLRGDEADAPAEDLTAVTAKELPEDEELPLGLLEPAAEPGLLGKLGSYDILRVIGRGGMGVVFLGRDLALDRLVAIKVLTPGMSATPAARRRFAREAKAAAAVVHEHVVAIHAVDSLPQGIPYLVMQYIAGKSAQEVIDRGKVPELAEILRIGSQAASALAAAHAQGLIHRDVKPANILLENGVERVKITDFGLARAVDDATMTQSGVVTGTPQYMSPEQAGGEPIDHRTDLFSLGSVLYTLCTGQAPFRGSSSMATLRKVCEQTPRPIQELNPEVPPWLVRIIGKLHAKDPADRYGSAAEVADLLGRCLAHVQQPASVPLPAGLLPTRKRRTMAILGAIPVCLMLVGLLSFPGAREAAGQAVSYMATVLRLMTPEGTLVVETDDPDVGIKLDGTELVVTGAGVKELRLAVGKHSIQAVKDGKVLRDELVTISRGGRTVLTVRREPEAVQPQPTPAQSPAPRLEFDKGPSGVFRRRQPAITNPGVYPNLSSQLQGFITSGVPSPAVKRLADILERNPPGPSENRPAGMRLFMRDLVEGKTSPIADPTVLGFPYAEMPSWSHDGRRIYFHIQPRINDWTQSRIVVLEEHEGRPGFRMLGAGCCVSVSPDDRTIAFLLLPGQVPGAEGGVWLMDADGTNRRRVCESGAPAWSPDGKKLLLNDWAEPANVRIHDPTVGRTLQVNLPGRKFYSWPRWVGPDQLVACVGDEKRADSLVLLNVSDPFQAEVTQTLWNRSFGPDVTPRWPLMSPSAPEFFFLGDAGRQRTLFALTLEERGPGRLSDLAKGGPKLSGLSISPDGRYLLFAADRLEPELPRPAPATIESRATQEIHRLADVLTMHAPRPAANRPEGMRLYIRDLVEGKTTLIVDPSVLGLPCAAVPTWSHDGRRILFHIQPRKSDWSRSRVVAIEDRDGRRDLRDLGAGCCASFSPDDRTIAFLLLPGEVPGQEGGVWLMDADGTNRRRVCVSAAPFWSPDGTQLLLNDWTEPNEPKLYSFATKRTTRVNLPGHKFYSWPRWAGPNQLVACIGGESKPDSIVLLDLSDPSEAKVVRTFWNRSSGPDIHPRWPVVSSTTDDCYFIGDAGNERTIYRLSSEAVGPMRLTALVTGGPKLSGLSLSPDGRYLLFDSDRVEPGPSGDAPGAIGDRAVQEADRLAEVLKAHPLQRAGTEGMRMQLYLRDMDDGVSTLIADEPIPGLVRTSSPNWSADGRRILFHASPEPNDWTRSEMMLLEARGGKPSVRSLGTENCPSYSPDGRQIAFLLWPGSVADRRGGVWLMNSDGSGRRRVADMGAPFWSPQGDKLLVNPFSEPTKCHILDLASGHSQGVFVRGHQLISWPRWVGQGRLVAVISTGRKDEQIVTLDVIDPADAKVLGILWKRSPELDVLPRWPLKRPSTGEFFFAGVHEPNRRNLYRLAAGEEGEAVRVQARAREDQLEGLVFSPGGRYLLFNANRPERR